MSLPSRPRPVVLVTGASAGIGAALARIYAAGRLGSDPDGPARSAAARALADELALSGAASTILTDDLADPAAPRRLFDAILAKGLTVDGLINNAGFSRTAGFLNTDPAAHRAMIQVMLAAPVELARLFAPAMVERGYRPYPQCRLPRRPDARDRRRHPVRADQELPDQGLTGPASGTARDRGSRYRPLPRLHPDGIPRRERHPRAGLIGLSGLDVADRRRMWRGSATRPARPTGRRSCRG